MRPVYKGESPQELTDYKQALPYLKERLGRYCSYCERRISHMLAVEHIQPKSHDDDLQFAWDNFLLACVNCNAIKGNKPIVLNDYYWPDQDNTARAFHYFTGGMIHVNQELPPEQQQRAWQTMELTGLNRLPGHRSFTRYDERWNDRREAWDIALRAKQRLQKHNTNEMREQIVETAQECGFWSVWMTLFRDDKDMLSRLITAFPGTCQMCFDGSFHPVFRSGGAL